MGAARQGNGRGREERREGSGEESGKNGRKNRKTAAFKRQFYGGEAECRNSGNPENRRGRDSGMPVFRDSGMPQGREGRPGGRLEVLKDA